MNNDKFDNVSIVGRIAYGIMCAENYLLGKYPEKNWTTVIEYFWKITNMEFWDEWADVVIEIIPEYMFEFKDYKSSGFELLSEEKYNELKDIYINTGNDVNEILKMVYELANSHIYSSIKGKGQESLEQLNRIIEYIKKHNIDLPDDKEILLHSIDERNGWGNLFDGSYLSKIMRI